MPSRERKLTALQAQYLAFIDQYTSLHRRPPSEADMQAYFKVTPPTVHQMVMTLAERGFISRVPGQPRSITLLVPRDVIPDLAGSSATRKTSRDKPSPRRRRPQRQLVLRATMRDIEPTIWRLLRVPDELTLHRLHRVLQIVFSRLDYHLYEFELGARRFRAPDPEADEESEDATQVTLADLELESAARMTYVYDFGDDWQHDLVVERFLPMPGLHGPDWTPRLMGGARAAPPEDAGGPSGFQQLLAALSDPEDPEHEEYRQWVGPHYDPALFDAWSLDHALALAVAWGAI